TVRSSEVLAFARAPAFVTTSLYFSGGYAGVPRDIMCSKKWAKPDFPGSISLRDPVCTGMYMATMFGKPVGTTMTLRPFGRVFSEAGNGMTSTAAGEGAPALQTQAPALPRLIIRTAEVSLIVGDTTTSVEKLAALASANGGYLTDSKIWRDGQLVRARLTIRVPAPKLDAALAAIRKVATRVESETVSGDDVTQEYVDLESQVRNLEAAEVEMRQLMTTVRERTKKAEDILQVYQQLVQLRGQIETAKGRMRYLSQMSAMSTIKLTLTPDAITKPVV